jgi:outer membrane receptor protein involved in Fe transport
MTKIIQEDTLRNTAGHTFYSEFQYNNSFAKYWTITAGLVESYSFVKANLFGNHNSNNLALYGQLDMKIRRLKLSGGLRLENYVLDKEHTKLLFNIIPIKPVFKLGANYELNERTFLRASIGQGYRFPSIAEKYTEASIAAATIYANPELKEETGWSGEIGIKQGYLINQQWRAYADVSVYHQQIYNMIEFGFGLFDPNTKREIPFNVDSINDAQYNRNLAIADMIGFQAKNIKNVMITGVDISGGISGKINKATINGTLSYTYNVPVYKGGIDATTSTTTNLLKYRFKHAIKADIQLDSRAFIVGAAFEWKSAIKNIDRMFFDERSTITDRNDIDFWYQVLSNEVVGPSILPGYGEYRKEHAKDNYVNFDANFGFKFSRNMKVVFVVRNILNQSFSGRPGDIVAPRRYEIMLTSKF